MHSVAKAVTSGFGSKTQEHRSRSFIERQVLSPHGTHGDPTVTFGLFQKPPAHVHAVEPGALASPATHARQGGNEFGSFQWFAAHTHAERCADVAGLVLSTASAAPHDRHNGLVVRSLKNLGAHTQAAAPADVAGLDESVFGPHVWHGGDADGSLKNVVAQKQSDFDVEVPTGLEESLGPHVWHIGEAATSL